MSVNALSAPAGDGSSWHEKEIRQGVSYCHFRADNIIVKLSLSPGSGLGETSQTTPLPHKIKALVPA